MFRDFELVTLKQEFVLKSFAPLNMSKGTETDRNSMSKLYFLAALTKQKSQSGY